MVGVLEMIEEVNAHNKSHVPFFYYLFLKTKTTAHNQTLPAIESIPWTVTTMSKSIHNNEQWNKDSKPI